MSSPSIPQRSPRASFAARASSLEWIAWILAWCVVRSALLLSFGDVFGYGEELEKACAAKAMLDGLGVPHHQLAYHYYEGGGFVISHLDALAFAVFGPSVLAIKLVALGFGAAILAASWKLCERVGGRNAARVFALLFVFAPESVQKNSLLTLGIHFHALFFVALVLDAAAVLIIERKLTSRRWLWLGITAGFGLFFSYQLVLTIAVAGSALLVAFKREVFRPVTAYVVLGFVIGATPLWWMAANVGGEVFDIHGAEVVGGSASAKLATLKLFFTSVFGGRGAVDWLALIALCTSPLLGVWALRSVNSRALRIGAWIVLLHTAVFLAAYLSTGFTVGRVYHYFLLHRLTPLWWLAAMFTSLGAVTAWTSTSRWKRALACAAIAALSLCGAIDTGRMVRDALHADSRNRDQLMLGENLECLARTKGYAYPEYLHKISPHLTGTTSDKLRVFMRFDETKWLRGSALLPEAIAIALYGDGAHELAAVKQELLDAGIEDRSSFYRGLGPMLRAQLGGDIASRIRAVEALPWEVSPDVREPLIEAIGRFGLGNLVTEDRVVKEIAQGFAANSSPRSLELYVRGVAHRTFDARGDLTIEHYFDMRSGPWMFDPIRAWHRCTDALTPEQREQIRNVNAVNANLEHWLPSPWWLGESDAEPSVFR